MKQFTFKTHLIKCIKKCISLGDRVKTVRVVLYKIVIKNLSKLKCDSKISKQFLQLKQDPVALNLLR